MPIDSKTISGSGQNGQWEYETTNELEPGTYTINIKGTDISGKSLSKSYTFVVSSGSPSSGGNDGGGYPTSGGNNSSDWGSGYDGVGDGYTGGGNGSADMPDTSLSYSDLIIGFGLSIVLISLLCYKFILKTIPIEDQFVD